MSGLQKLIGCIRDNIKQVIIGKDEVIDCIIICLLSEGHILLEGLPGVGKTKLALALARSVEGSFKRIQFTPDVLPSDITGFYMYNKGTNDWEYREGAVMCHFLLADEINRASPRVQSSLLEAMAERQITVEGKVKVLPRPFMVIATQNAIESQGTYPLPEAQLDRFFMKLEMKYPTRTQWKSILDQSEKLDPLKGLEAVVTLEALEEAKDILSNIFVSDAVKEYILDVTETIGENKNVKMGISPRGSIALLRAAKGYALLRGRDYVVPDDVLYMVEPVLEHRILLESTANWGSNKPHLVLNKVMQEVKPPVFV